MREFLWFWLLPRLGLIFVGMLLFTALFVIWVLLDNYRMRRTQPRRPDAHTAPYLPTTAYEMDWAAFKQEAMAQVDHLFRELNEERKEER